MNRQIMNNEKTITTKDIFNMDNRYLLNNKKESKVSALDIMEEMKVLRTKDNKEDVIVISSRDLAKIFNKTHPNVLRDIRNLINNSHPSNLMTEFFYPNTYENSRGRKYEEYLLTKDGFALLAMGFTGKEATMFKIEFIKAFNQKEEEIKLLKEDLVSLHNVAISDETRVKREEEANRALYAFRNIKTVLESASYNELEDKVYKILDHHEKLNKKYKYKNHQNMNDTEYKQHVRKYIIEKLEEVSIEKKDMLFHNVSDQIIKDLKGDIISTLNRSNGAKISNYKKELNMLKDNQKEEYNIEDLIELKIHPFSVNDMYTYREEIGRITKTDKYRKWIHNFPKEEAFLALRDEFYIEHLVDYDKPLKMIMRVDAKEKMDIDNMSKSFIDVIMNDVLGLDDNLIDSVDIKRNNNVDTYEEGTIYFTIRNV